MEPITVKFENEFIQYIEKIMKKHRYATKAEFIREAIRDKIKYLERQNLLERAKSLYGSSRRKTTDEQLHKVREEIFEELEKELS